MNIRTFRIFWGHSGRRDYEWSTAREASHYASTLWGTVDATSIDEALTMIEREGVDWDDYWHDGESNIHIICKED